MIFEKIKNNFVTLLQSKVSIQRHHAVRFSYICLAEAVLRTARRKIKSIGAAKKGGHSAASFRRFIPPSNIMHWAKFFVVLPKR